MTVLESTVVTRYVTPLREGGSLPGLCEAADLGTYVVKFHGAGQGPKVLVAEVIVGELARRLGIRVPDLKVVELDPAIGRREPDPEVAELLVRSAGANLAVDFLPGALGYDGVSFAPDPALAARILWLDAYVANVDRSWRNPNLLLWHGQLWAIDHGAALYFHHAWKDPATFAAQTYDASDHILLERAGDLASVDAELRAQVSSALLESVVALVPDAWLAADFGARVAGRDARRLPRAPRGASVHLPVATGGGGVSRRPFEYLVLRAVPRVDRGERINVGVVVYCQADDYLAAATRLDVVRLHMLDAGADEGAVDAALRAVDTLCRGERAAGPLAGEAPGVRFRWLAAPRSTVVQPGPVHSGLTADPAAELDRLFAELVA